MRTIRALPLSPEGFAPFGQILAPRPAPTRMINGGRCERHHALGRVELRAGGEAVISIFRSQPVSLPCELRLLERHPLGSQGFMPLGGDPWLSIVAPEAEDGRPGTPLAFLVPAGVGVNLRAGVWHGVLSPLDRPEDFLVIDRDGPGDNLEECAIPPVLVTP